MSYNYRIIFEDNTSVSGTWYNDLNTLFQLIIGTKDTKEIKISLNRGENNGD